MAGKNSGTKAEKGRAVSIRRMQAMLGITQKAHNLCNHKHKITVTNKLL